MGLPGAKSSDRVSRSRKAQTRADFLARVRQQADQIKKSEPETVAKKSKPKKKQPEKRKDVYAAGTTGNDYKGWSEIERRWREWRGSKKVKTKGFGWKDAVDVAKEKIKESWKEIKSKLPGNKKAKVKNLKRVTLPQNRPVTWAVSHKQAQPLNDVISAHGFEAAKYRANIRQSYKYPMREPRVDCVSPPFFRDRASNPADDSDWATVGAIVGLPVAVAATAFVVTQPELWPLIPAGFSAAQLAR